MQDEKKNHIKGQGKPSMAKAKKKASPPPYYPEVPNINESYQDVDDQMQYETQDQLCQSKAPNMSTEPVQGLENMPLPCKFLMIHAYRNMTRLGTMIVPLEVFTYEEDLLIIPREDIIQFCRMEQISVSCVVFYIR